MTTIVITGSTRGIGYGLAKAFLEKGCNVVINGRTQEAVNQAVSQLAAVDSAERILGLPVDVAMFDQVRVLWRSSQERFGAIDCWINNAGIANPLMDFWELDAGQFRSLLETNLLGALYGCKVAMQGMLQQGFGKIYNMEGMGSDGKVRVRGLLPYGLTKAGIAFLTNALAIEAKGTGIVIGAIRPGMVYTDKLATQYKDRPDEWERVKKVLAVLTDRVETVAPWIAQKILENQVSGVRIRWNTPARTLKKFLLLPFRKTDPFD